VRSVRDGKTLGYIRLYPTLSYSHSTCALIAVAALGGILFRAPSAPAQVVATDSTPRGLRSTQAASSSGVHVANGPTGAELSKPAGGENGAPISTPLSDEQCRRIRDKVVRDPSLNTTYTEQLTQCNSLQAAAGQVGAEATLEATTKKLVVPGVRVHDAPRKSPPKITP
jgi:hypothetical protein